MYQAVQFSQIVVDVSLRINRAMVASPLALNRAQKWGSGSRSEEAALAHGHAYKSMCENLSAKKDTSTHCGYFTAMVIVNVVEWIYL